MANQQNTQDKNSAATAAATGKSTTADKKSQDNQVVSDKTIDKATSVVGDVLDGNTSKVSDTAKGIVSQVKESGGRIAGEAIGQVKEKASVKIDEQKNNLAQNLGGVAQTIRHLGENLKSTEIPAGVASTTAEYGDKLAQQVEQFSNYLEKHNVGQMMKDVENFARRNPAYFIGGAFLLGFLGARFLKSSSNRNRTSTKDGEEVFHAHSKTRLSSEGVPITTSGEGVRPV